MNTTVYDWPVERNGLFHKPLGLGELPLVVVWLTPSWLVHLTDVPTFIVRFCGTKANPCMLTSSRPGGHVGVGVLVCVGVPVFVGVSTGKLKVDVGNEQRTIVAGIAEAYQPEQLVGRTIAIVFNLKPAKLMGIESNGMVLAASVGDGRPILVSFDEPVPPGARVR